MQNINNKVFEFLKEYDLLAEKKVFIIGFSGGFDSMTMLDVLSNFSEKYGFKLVAVHLNHNWRGEESDAEEQNCLDFCLKKDIQFYSERLAEGVSKTETAAREARQKFYLNCAKKFNADALFLAHTKSDNTETIIYRMAKGTGVNGLCGIYEHSKLKNIEVYRPLMDCDRKEIEEYCTENNLSPNSDSSNADKKYKRNYIRHEIIPALSQINTDIDNAVKKLSEVAMSEQNIINEYIKLLKKDLYQDEKIITEKFSALSYDVQKRLIYELFINNELDYDNEKINRVHRFIFDNKNSKAIKTISLSTELLLCVSTEYIYIFNQVEIKKQNDVIKIDTTGIFQFGNKILKIEKYIKDEPFPKETDNYALVSDLKFPLTLRTRRDGDTFAPFGMKGSMKLKKFFINKNIDKYMRDEIVLLCNQKEILWIPQICLSEKLRVKKRPHYKISMEEG